MLAASTVSTTSILPLGQNVGHTPGAVARSTHPASTAASHATRCALIGRGSPSRTHPGAARPGSSGPPSPGPPRAPPRPPPTPPAAARTPPRAGPPTPRRDHQPRAGFRGWMGGRRGRFVAVSRRDDDQITLPHAPPEPRNPGVELQQPFMNPRHVVAVPPGLVELDHVDED